MFKLHFRLLVDLVGHVRDHIIIKTSLRKQVLLLLRDKVGWRTKITLYLRNISSTSESFHVVSRVMQQI